MKDVCLDPALCFQLLQLPLTATVAEVKAAYRILARQCHPDQNRHDPKATEKFSILHQAYQGALHYLKTPQSQAVSPKRKQADRPDQSRFKPPAEMRKLSQQQRRTRARKAYRNALDCLKHMQDDRAWSVLQEALWLNPTDVAIRYKLEDVALYTGRLRELEAFLQVVDHDRPQVTPPHSHTAIAPRPSPPLVTPPPQAEAPPEPPEAPEVLEAPEVSEPEWQFTATTPIAIETLSLENLAVPNTSAPELPGDNRRQRPAPRRRPQQQQDTTEILLLPSLLHALNQLLRHPSVASTARAWKKAPWQALLLLALGGLGGSLLTVLVYRLSAPSGSAIAPPTATATAQVLHQSNPAAD